MDMKKGWLYLAAVCLLGAGCLCLAPGRQEAAPTLPPVQTAAPGPLAGRVILVDAGHGGYDGGARAGQSGLWEKEINLQVALALEDALEDAGARVVMTRREDRDFGDTKRADLDARLNMAKENGADLLLSIHMNQYPDERESGPQVFYRKGSEESRLLAGCIQASLLQNLQPKRQRQALSGDYYMLGLNIPSVLVECGFLSNRQEERMLLDGAYQQKLAQAITRGVEEFETLNKGK